MFLRIKVSPAQNLAIKQFFLPVLFTTFGGAATGNIGTFNTSKTIEAFGQPASRIGAAPPLNSSSTTRAADFIGFSSFPLALSNQQFAQAASPSATSTTYTIDIVSSTSNEYTSAPPAGHIKGCFVNVTAAAGTGSSAYGSGQGNLAIDQLEGLFNYYAKNPQQVSTPASLEQGSLLNAFDPADPAYIARQSEIYKSFSNIITAPGAPRFFIVPVLATDPSFSGPNTIVGFAWLSLGQISTTANQTTITMTLGSSVPVRNATSATGFANQTTTSTTQTLLPKPLYPFTPRTVDLTSNAVSLRPRGIVLAPALSPRQLNGT